MMMPIGGEHEVAKSSFFKTLTSSGRDSLRLIIESGKLHDRVFLLPDFLCDIVPIILNEYSIQYRHYTVHNDLSFDLGSIDDDDVVYITNYFGQHQQDSLRYINNNTVIIDDVFSPFPYIPHTSSWYSFNSLRKISPLADGSIVYSSQPLAEQCIQFESGSEFSNKKYVAKNKKFDVIHHGRGEEEEYLALFAAAEKMLNNQKPISSMSIASQLAFADFCVKLEDERLLRQKNYNMVRELLPDSVIPIQTNFYSFAPLFLAERDAIKSHLMKHRIFLPVHWPCTSMLSQHILSIPLDSRYSPEHMRAVCALIGQYKK